jgi:hypothetical protein
LIDLKEKNLQLKTRMETKFQISKFYFMIFKKPSLHLILISSFSEVMQDLMKIFRFEIVIDVIMLMFILKNGVICVLIVTTLWLLKWIVCIFILWEHNDSWKETKSFEGMHCDWIWFDWIDGMKYDVNIVVNVYIWGQSCQGGLKSPIGR